MGVVREEGARTTPTRRPAWLDDGVGARKHVVTGVYGRTREGVQGRLENVEADHFATRETANRGQRTSETREARFEK